MKRLHIPAGWTALCLMLATAHFARAQVGLGAPALPAGEDTVRPILDLYPEKPSLPPTFTIPAIPLGFLVPGSNYLLRKESLVSLDFLDENRLLFTFHVSSGLMQRDDDDSKEGERQRVEAVVILLPSGKIESRATWTVPDRSRYLWMLNNGTFLLRVSEGLDQGDAQLRMKPYLRQPDKLLWIQMDPKQQVMITNSLEPATASQQMAASTTAGGSPTADGQKPGQQNVLVTRTVKRASGDVLRVSRAWWTHQTADWPMNSEGYLERSKSEENRWVLKLNSFAGQDRVVTTVDSTCPPRYGFTSETELLVAKCDPKHGWMLEAISDRGDSLWTEKAAINAIWPLLVTAGDGSRAARETLLLRRSVDHYKRMIGAPDFRGQMVRVFDADNGKTVLEAPLNPMFDGGGNVAISPSGQRVAILNAGAIQVFQLPPPSASTHH